MIDLCKVFGVEEGEEFKLDVFPFRNNKYKVYKNELQFKTEYDDIWRLSDMGINTIVNCKVIKLPKKKEFTDDELGIMRSLLKKYEWVARDNDGELYIFRSYKPKKENGCWDNKGLFRKLALFNHIFNSIQWEDEEPVYIDDYVERGVE
jgi:hypothetical protein